MGTTSAHSHHSRSLWRRLTRGAPVAALAATLTAMLALVACGVPANIPAGDASTTATASAASTATAGATPMSSNLPTDAVTLTTDHSSYAPSSTIIVTLINHRAGSIRTFDHQTSCSILTLQRQTASGWQNVGGCAMGRVTRIVEITAGETQKIALSPAAGQIHPTPWPAGTYRAVLHYALPGEDMSAAIAATTPTFTIA